MSCHHTVATWSAGLLATATAALLTASATLPASAAYLEVDGGVAQVFVIRGADLPDTNPIDPPGPPGHGPPPEDPPGTPGNGSPDEPPRNDAPSESPGDGGSRPTSPPRSDEPEPREVRYDDCEAARDADAAPLESDDPGYRDKLDTDGDGVACEENELEGRSSKGSDRGESDSARSDTKGS